LTTDYTEDTLDLTDFESTVKTVNAKALKTGITIIGNAKDNSIVGGLAMIQSSVAKAKTR